MKISVPVSFRSRFLLYKRIFLVATVLLSSLVALSQQYTNPPGSDKFAGFWKYINGQDTLTMAIKTTYFGNSNAQLKIILAYYTYKQGNTIIWNNMNNLPDNYKTDLGGSTPFGSNLDSLVVGGEDKLKRKRDEGYFVINSSETQITYTRSIGVTGGGLSHHAPGQGPLSGFTLPATFTLQRIPLTSEERQRLQ